MNFCSEDFKVTSFLFSFHNFSLLFREGNSRDEGTRSSSGNWSGSSSTRTSLESDIQQQQHNHLPKTASAFTATPAVANTTREEEEDDCSRLSGGLQNSQEENSRKEETTSERTSPSSFDQESFYSE